MTDTTQQPARPMPPHPREPGRSWGPPWSCTDDTTALALIALVAVMLRICEDYRRVNP
jgi:hypothetical protein